jgi:hypothetical protein
MTEAYPYLSVIVLNVNGLNPPVTRFRFVKWIQSDSMICYLQEAHFTDKDAHRLKMKRWKKSHANRNQKWSALLSDKVHPKFKNKKVHYIMMKGSIQ